jgi:ribonuclease BN (tRNA processing enzyme)
MHKITFFPLGNADCCRIDLENGKKLLFDYANMKNKNDEADLRIDLEETLKNDLKESKKDYFDVVSFSHADNDHVHGLSEFFYLDHAQKYQGEGRIKIDELWVPAAILVETNPPEDVRVLRQEARFRLKNKKGIKIFSEPELLKNWIEEDEDLKYEDCKPFIFEAGNLIQGFTKESDGVEFFIHAPFKTQLGDEVLNRNDCSSVFQAVFEVDGEETKFMIIGDTEYSTISDIVKISEYYGNDDRLEWDIYDIPHHCSYKALGDDKGKDKTVVDKNVQRLLNKGNEHGILISCSKPIPNNDEDSQPPHRQAKAVYEEIADNIDGEFKVTMEFPTKKKPEPIIITIDSNKAKIKKKSVSSGAAIITSTKAPRAGV